MPKMKTRKAASKRFSVTGSGKIRHKQANKNHKTSKMTPKRRRNLQTGILTKADSKAFQVLMPKSC